MKKSLLLIATIAMAMAACTKDAPETEFGAPVAPYSDICVNATIDGDTRTSMTPHADGGLDIAWVAGDGIGMFAEDANGAIGNNTKYTAATSEATSKFIIGEGETSIKWGEGEHTFYAYYPYSSEAAEVTAVPIEVPAVQTQSEAGNMDHLQPYAFLYAQKSVNASASVDLKFSNALSVLEVNLCSEFGSIDCEAVIFRAEDGSEVLSTESATINLTDGVINTSAATNSNQIKVELTNNATLDTENPQSFYMMITPGHGGKRFSFYAVVNGKEVKLGSKKIPASGLPAGAKATIDLNVPAVDLSTDGTANCYILSKPSTTYKFKATVMGNGATTTGITPSALNPTTADLLWTSEYGDAGKFNSLNLTVEYNDGYIYVTTPDTFVNGNAGVAAYNESDEIIWSWHLWCVKDYNPYKTAIASTKKSNINQNAVPALWMD
ncbi:MAG: fimbrillin family protein, partial [Rikenellaceae bacterium]|nr:fimbrillin family protein [Rikenellaceae bacterium]